MNKIKLMVVALCAATSVTTTAVAEDNFGIESASPVIVADPVNPQPGMQLFGYRSGNRFGRWTGEWLKGSIAGLSKAPAIKSIVDKSEDYSLKALGATKSNAGRWTGFLKCKRAGVYTLTISSGRHTGYSLRVNGKQAVLAAQGQKAVDVSLKIGWNKVDLVCHFSAPLDRVPVTITYKPKESLSEARQLTPAMMFHDQKPEEEW